MSTINTVIDRIQGSQKVDGRMIISVVKIWYLGNWNVSTWDQYCFSPYQVL